MKQFTLLFLLFISSVSFGQGYKIEVELPAARDSQVFLANYFLTNIYIKDTLQLDASGKGTFTADTLLPQGLYKMYRDENMHFDFLLGGDQNLKIGNPTFSSQTVEIDGATETEEFIAYTHFLSDLKKQGSEIRKKIESAPPVEKKQLQAEMDGLTQKLHNYWFDIEKKYPDTFLSAFLLANYVPSLKVESLPPEIQNNDSLLLIEKFKYQQAHFWDYLDYTDERFLYTPLLKPKMETWFKQVLYQNYDSIKPAVYQFIEDVRPSKRLFQFATSHFLNAGITSNILGMDALFVDLARDYYLSGQAFWAGEESLKNIKENVVFLENTLIGETAPDLTLENVDGEFVNLHKIGAKLTVVLIYEPNCSHCKVFVPKFHDEIYAKYKDKGLEVFAIYSMDNKEEWVEFLTKHNLFDWINVWDEDHSSQFKILYDARQTPRVYVLDENKKILVKKLSVEQLEDFVGYQLN